MKYIVYSTKNLKSKINGINRVYIGVYSVNNLEDKDYYLGCGCFINQASTYMYPKTPFQYAVKKYGVKSFEKTILYVYDTLDEALQKEKELLDEKFLNSSHTYNASVCDYKPLYQFDLNGKFCKKWDSEIFDFFGLPKEKFDYAVKNKYKLLNSFWSYKSKIEITEYTKNTNLIYLYSLDGKWLREFVSIKECANHLKVKEIEIKNAVRDQLEIKNYYVSNKLVDEFKPKPRTNLIRAIFYVYNANGDFLGKYKGKEVMPVIKTNSWKKIQNAFKLHNNWYQNYYLSFKETTPPKKENYAIKLDVFTLDGEYKETLHTFNEAKEKYNISSSVLKNIQQGNRYYNDYIFKYSK